MRLRARTPGTREARSHWRSSRLPRRSFQRDPDDFGAHAAPQTAKHCSGHQATPHEQAECLSGWFFGTDGDDCLGALLKIGVLSDEFVLWNAFPWHSFDPRRGPLSNRMPNKSEQLSGRPVLKAFLELFPCEQVVALGKIAAAQLEKLDVAARCARHPASGGAKLFRQQIVAIVNKVI